MDSFRDGDRSAWDVIIIAFSAEKVKKGGDFPSKMFVFRIILKNSCYLCKVTTGRKAFVIIVVGVQK